MILVADYVMSNLYTKFGTQIWHNIMVNPYGDLILLLFCKFKIMLRSFFPKE